MESVRDFLNNGSVEEEFPSHPVLGAEVDDNDSFVDIMSGITAVGSAELETWTFVDALARANSSVETLAEGVVDTTHLLTC